VNDRHFWSRYGGGVDANVLRYLAAQGYAQSAGGVEDTDATAQTVRGADTSTPDEKQKDDSKMRRSPSGKLLAALALGAGMQVVRSFGRLDDLART